SHRGQVPWPGLGLGPAQAPRRRFPTPSATDHHTLVRNDIGAASPARQGVRKRTEGDSELINQSSYFRIGEHVEIGYPVFRRPAIRHRFMPGEGLEFGTLHAGVAHQYVDAWL